MYNINKKILMERVYNPIVFEKGEKYFLDNRVKSVKANSSYSYFQGIIKGNSDYTSTVNFNDRGSIKSTSCNCKDFDKYTGDCKHIIALLHFIRVFQNRKSEEKSREENLKKIISYYEEENRTRNYLNIEYNLEFNFKDEDEFFQEVYLSLRIGEDKLYSLRDPSMLFKHLDNNQELRFGQNFTLIPSIHRFREEDKEIINFIRILYENFAIYGEGNGSKIFTNKRIHLTPTSLKRFFNLINDRKFNISISRVDYEEVEIIKEDIPLDMQISSEGEDLLINLNSNKDMVLLTRDAQYIFSNMKVYSISKEQRKKILPLYKEIILKGKGKIKISKEYKEPFISNVLPNIKDIIDLNIDEEVEKSIYRPDLKTEIYFDKIGDSILGKIEFIYGKIIINPFSSKENKNINSNKILIRDGEQEGNILSLLEEGEFRVLDGGIYLDQDEEIFDLVSNIIPKLQENSHIYYSESFKDINIYSSRYYSGGVGINHDLDLLEFNFNIDGVDEIELEDLLNSIRKNKKFYRLKNGSFLPLEGEDFNHITKIMKDFNINIENGKIQVPKYMSMYLETYLKDNQLKFIEQGKDFRKLVKDVKDPKDIDYPIPKNLDEILRDYQKFGFKWLKTMASYGFGGILADDMGLGKTLQIISFLLSEREEKGKKPSLIIVPTSLVFNWEEEISRFAPELKTLLVHGTKDERAELIKTVLNYDIVVTSYPLIRNDVELYESFTFRYCILDEAQHIKNRNSLNAKSVKLIKATNYFALTGTPMENSVIELWSIFDFLMPGYLLSNKEFIEKYEKPIFKKKDKKALENLNKHIGPFVLRRLKKDVLQELPEKIEQQILVDMTVEQRKVYLAYIKSLKEELEEEINHKGFNKTHFKILTALTRLRQICCDPALFIEDYKGGSGKVDFFEELIDDAIQGGHRILVFSQFTSMLDKIKLKLDEENIDNMHLNGSTPLNLRGEMVNEFNQGYGDIFLISLKAGGSGLNLTGADMVIHFDPWWNPAVEDQATDRAYRIGQKNTVQVIKLITKGTIEEKIFKLQKRKKEMIDMIIQQGETLISKLSKEEILSLFDI